MKKELSPAMKQLLAAVSVIVTFIGLIWNQIGLTDEVKSLRTDLEGVQATIADEVTPTASPTAAVTVTPSVTERPTRAPQVTRSVSPTVSPTE